MQADLENEAQQPLEIGGRIVRFDATTLSDVKIAGVAREVRLLLRRRVTVRIYSLSHTANPNHASQVRPHECPDCSRGGSSSASTLNEAQQRAADFGRDPLTGRFRRGPLLVDEDYLILSTIHSAKGQEWNSVYVLNVTDGTFPSEFATGKPDLIEEERRLLYVAMTRAKHELHLITPLKYYITQQSRAGDAHLYGARSRFLTAQMMQRFECVSWPPAAGPTAAKSSGALPRIDAAAKIRAMW